MLSRGPQGDCLVADASRVLVNADNPSLAIDTSIRVVLVVSRDVRIGWHRPRSARATA